MEMHGFKTKQKLVCVSSVRTPTEDSPFQPRSAELAPRLLCQAGGHPPHTPLSTGIFGGEGPLPPPDHFYPMGGGDWPGPRHTQKRWTGAEGGGPRPCQLLTPSPKVWIFHSCMWNMRH